MFLPAGLQADVSMAPSGAAEVSDDIVGLSSGVAHSNAVSTVNKEVGGVESLN